MTKFNYLFTGLLCSTLFLAAACSPEVERGTGQALSNTGSAINHVSGKVWLPPEGAEPAGTVSDEDDEELS